MSDKVQEKLPPQLQPISKDILNKYTRVLAYQITPESYDRNIKLFDQVTVEMLYNAIKITREAKDRGQFNNDENEASKHRTHSYLCGILWKMARGDMPANPEDELVAVEPVDLDTIK